MDLSPERTIESEKTTIWIIAPNGKIFAIIPKHDSITFTHHKKEVVAKKVGRVGKHPRGQLFSPSPPFSGLLG